ADLIEGATELDGAAALACIPADVLARKQDAAEFTVQLVQFPDVAEEPVAHLRQWAACQQFAGIEVVADLLEYPRVALRGTADHDTIRTGVSQHLSCLGGTVDIAVGDDGDGHALLDGGDRVVFHAAREAAFAGATMHR